MSIRAGFDEIYVSDKNEHIICEEVSHKLYS